MNFWNMDKDETIVLENINLKELNGHPPVTTKIMKVIPNANINPDNSFDYSLPVVSRTIVNKVNVSYYVLEELKPDEDNEPDKGEFKGLFNCRKYYNCNC